MGYAESNFAIWLLNNIFSVRKILSAGILIVALKE
jgi:hypothetical protein